MSTVATLWNSARRRVSATILIDYSDDNLERRPGDFGSRVPAGMRNTDLESRSELKVVHRGGDHPTLSEPREAQLDIKNTTTGIVQEALLWCG